MIYNKLRKKILTILVLNSVFINLQSQECGIVYVTPNGASSGVAGTKANPANLNYGLSLANASNPVIRMAVGNYPISQALILKDNVILEGGFLPNQNWAKTNADSSVIVRDASNIQNNPLRLVGIIADSISNFRLQDLRIRVADAPGNGVTVYGVWLRKCRNYNIVRCRIHVGKGSDGIDGIDGIDGLSGSNGGDGGVGCRRCDPTPAQLAGGLGGNSWSAGAAKGGNGGQGAARGTGTNCDFIFVACPGNDLCHPSQATAPGGANGQNGSGTVIAQGGLGKAGLCYCNNGLNPTDIATFLASCPTQDTTYKGLDGQNGANGVDGNNGTNGTAIFANGFFNPADGTDGTDGTDGSGGAGGGGGGSIGCIPGLNGLSDGLNSSGAAGGGGGEGGQRGTKGTKGTGAGGSFPIFVWQNGPNGKIKDCILTSNGAGVGGQGGNIYLASSGAIRGSGCEGGAGGNGGNGGRGGNGGKGGNGSDGQFIPIYQGGTPASPLIIQQQMDTLEAPITVSFSGCANTIANISTASPATIIEWFLGGIPNSAVGNNVSTEYDNTGFKSLSLRVDGIPFTYTDFVNISVPYVQPKITSNLQTICSGQSIQLSTNAIANAYSWTIPGGSITSFNGQNPGTVTFNSPGQYPVQLQTTTCCGLSKVDTLMVYVLSNNSDANLPSDQTLCVTDTLPILSVNAFPNASYQWKKDGVNVGNSSTLQTTAAGQYTLEITYGSGCIARDTFNLTIIQNLTVNLGLDTTVCIYDIPPVLDAGIPGADYFWTRNGVPFGTTQQIQTNLPGFYAVLVTSPTGCTGYDEIKIEYSTLSVDLGDDRTLCPINGANIILDAGIPNAQYQWFINGVPSGNSQTISSSISGTYSLIVTNQYGCMATDSVNITVASVLNADFSAPSTVTSGQPVNFSDISTGTITSWTWNFGGNNYSNLQNPTFTFTEPGEIPVFLVVSNGLCTDTIVKIINVLLDCSTLGLNANFDINPDTLDLNANSLAQFTNTSTNALTYEWIFHDGQVLNDPNVSKAYLAEGTYNIKLIVRNYNCVDSIEKQIVVIKPSLISNDKGLEPLQVLVYPNPTEGNLYLSFEQPIKNFQVELLDVNGKNVTFQKEQLSYQNFKMDISHLSSGVYVLKLQNSNQQTIIRIIKL